MGYIGLLLNAPYKIDSMVWMRLGLSTFFTCLSRCFIFITGYINQEVWKVRDWGNVHNQGFRG
jgi:hypothetical protein